MQIKNREINKILNIIIDFIDYIRIRSHFNILFLLKRFFIRFKAKVVFIVEDVDWAVSWVGRNIVANLKKKNLINIEYDRLYNGKNKIIHFGSINCLKRNKNIFKLKASNKSILTFFHVSPDIIIKNYIPYLNKKLDLIHTSNNISKNTLINLGFDKKKIIVIPLGVDLALFKNYDPKSKARFKKYFNLPTDKIIIGSFQKDGTGWGDGIKPKSIKGPDIFCEVVKRLNENFKIHVFLTGPARGYIKQKLNDYKISYTHVFINNYHKMVYCFNSIDLYIITSRIEGGPLALLEGMASGVPIVSTKVGMAPETIQNGINGFITEINDINKLFEYSVRILSDKELNAKIIKNGLITVKKYDWEKIANQYYFKLYKKFL